MGKKKRNSNVYIAALALGALAIDQVMNQKTRIDVDELKKSAKEMNKDVQDTGKSVLAQQKVLKEMSKQLVDIGKRLKKLENSLIVNKGDGTSEQVDLSVILKEYRELATHVKDLTDTVSDIREGNKKVSPEQYKAILGRISRINDHITEMQKRMLANADMIGLCVAALRDNGFIEEVEEDDESEEPIEPEKEIKVPPVNLPDINDPVPVVYPEKKVERKERESKPLTQSLGEQIRKATSGVVAK